MTHSVPHHFALFGLEPRFALDADALEAAYKRVQDKVHPDRYAACTAAEKRIAMQWAARANEALQTLRSPARRATYLCELNGVTLDAESNTAMPPQFLLQQLEWREALSEAAGAAHGDRLQALAHEAHAARTVLLDELARSIDVARDFGRAAALVRQLLFIDKLREEIEGACHAHADAAAASGAG